ncbi:hypothetical protein [Helicobacter marmotae]|uniref:Uncharacterized protein n=1 Tax=Helicobacter marmotae TaxID=152490 RepID=A0A3D8I2A3_9HELI|nr:hypothetical protein [Helicobacter marmotae]RDU59270.1 hypothetical protein CQA63_07435 [Helicobacter marmotae]
MKKTFVFLVLASLLGANFCSGAESLKDSKVTSLSQADMEALFQTSNVNAIVLSEEEMKNTQGEADPITIGIAVGAGIATYQAVDRLWKKVFRW